MTLINTAWFLGAALALFIAVSMYNEFRHRDPSRERLFELGSRTSTAEPQAPLPPLTPVSDETYVTRGPLQRDIPLALPPPPSSPIPPPPTAATLRTLKEAKQRGERMVITGGADGLQVEVRPAVPPRRR